MKTIISSLFLCAAFGLNAQSSYTLQGAIDYALANNANHLNAVVDEQLAEMKKKEIRGIGLPQIGASADMNNFLNIPYIISILQ